MAVGDYYIESDSMPSVPWFDGWGGGGTHSNYANPNGGPGNLWAAPGSTEWQSYDPSIPHISVADWAAMQQRAAAAGRLDQNSPHNNPQLALQWARAHPGSLGGHFNMNPNILRLAQSLGFGAAPSSAAPTALPTNPVQGTGGQFPGHEGGLPQVVAAVQDLISKGRAGRVGKKFSRKPDALDWQLS
jgi:hypothetical protein